MKKSSVRDINSFELVLTWFELSVDFTGTCSVVCTLSLAGEVLINQNQWDLAKGKSIGFLTLQMESYNEIAKLERKCFSI